MRLILEVMLVLVALGTFVGAAWAPEVRGPFPISETAMGVIFCAVLALLLLANQLGHWQFATWCTLACLVMSGSIFFDLASLDRVLIVMATPVLLGAFLLRPRAAFELAALGGVLYTLEWVRHGPQPGFNFLSLMALVGIAVLAYLFGRRIEWLEEAEDIAGHEIDRLADERDVLKGQVRALAEELERRDAVERDERPDGAMAGAWPSH